MKEQQLACFGIRILRKKKRRSTGVERRGRGRRGEMTTPEKKEKRRMARTARPKFVTIDGKEYVKCPHPDCDYMVENPGYNPNSGIRLKYLYGEEKVYKHIREVHKLVWLRKGKTAGWWPLSKFHHPTKQEEEEEG